MEQDYQVVITVGICMPVKAASAAEAEQNILDANPTVLLSSLPGSAYVQIESADVLDLWRESNDIHL